MDPEQMAREEELCTLLALARSMILSGEKMTKPVAQRIEAALQASRQARENSSPATPA